MLQLVRKRAPVNKDNNQSATILVKTCVDPVAVKTYEDLKVLLEEKYQNINFTFKQEYYPVPLWRDVLGRMFNAIFALFCLILVAILVIPKTSYAYLISDNFMALFKSKKWVLCGVAFVLNYVSERLQKTGAFEIYYNDELVSSKLADGDYPSEEIVFNFIDKKIE